MISTSAEKVLNFSIFNLTIWSTDPDLLVFGICSGSLKLRCTADNLADKLIRDIFLGEICIPLIFPGLRGISLHRGVISKTGDNRGIDSPLTAFNILMFLRAHVYL